MALRQWDPIKYLEVDKPEEKCALIQLNTPLPLQLDKFKKLWAVASYRVVADGAANELYDNPNLSHEEYIPDVILGDLDSARPDVLEFYKQKCCPVLLTPDQNATDFTKSVKHILAHAEKENLKITCIMTQVGICGRFDHVLGNISTLFMANISRQLPIYLMSAESITWLLPTGKHEINVQSKFRGDWCGLLPIGCPCDVTTSGLKWNLTDSRLEFGHLVSTSNTFDGSPTVKIETNNPLVWTMGLL